MQESSSRGGIREKAIDGLNNKKKGSGKREDIVEKSATREES